MISSSQEPQPDGLELLPEDITLEQTLRPQTLDEYIGQQKLKDNLSLVIQATKKRKQPLEHVLLYGPPGLGKTTLAHIIAKELGANLKTTSGPAIEKAGDLAAILTNLEPGSVLFIDEIHRMNRVIEELLYPALEDGVLDIMIGKGPGAQSIRMELPPFTLIAATTRAGLLSGPLRDRFGLLYHLDFYSPEEIAEIVLRSGKVLGVEIEKPAAILLAHRSRLTPRIANRLLRRLRDYAQVGNHSSITEAVTLACMDLLEVDNLGLDKHDRQLLELLVVKFNGGPVGLNTLAAALGEEPDTITDVYEPFLLRQGLIARTNKGRVATNTTYLHLNKKSPSLPL